jgi:putative ABC transport system permease protein
VLRIGPAFGRWFGPEDEGRGAARVVVLSHEMWRQEYASDSGAVGRTLKIYDEPWTIIGVMPSGAGHPLHADFWIPMGGSGGQVIARPRPGTSIDQIRRDLARLSTPVAGAKGAAQPRDVVVMSLHDQLYGSARPTLRILFWAVLLLLLIACANIANLSLARTLGRGREMAVRAALGASRWSLASSVLIENVLLALAGGATGALVGFWTTRIFVRLSPDEITRVGGIDVNGSGLLYVALLALLTGLVVSIGPALAVARGDLIPALGQGGQRSGRGRVAQRLRRLLVVAQIAIALLLVTGAGLLLRSMVRLTSVDMGFNPRGIGHVVDVFGNIADRLRVLPGVEAVGYGPPPLVAGRGQRLREGFDMMWSGPFVNASGPDSTVRTIWVKFVDAGYLSTFRIPIRSGRGILASDNATAPAVAIVNSAAAKLFFPDGNVIGRSFLQAPPSLSGGRPITVVGEFDDALQRDVAMAAEPELLVPSPQQERGTAFASIGVRTSGDAKALMDAVRHVIKDVDPDLPTMKLTTMQTVVEASLAPHRFLLVLLTAFAALALVLASLGLYAVVAYLVAQRTQEVGVRIALGAQQYQVQAMVVREGMALVAVGIAIGVPAALALSNFLTKFLYEVKPRDIQTVVAAPILLAAVTLVAAYLPARRASKVDPMRVLWRE